MNTDPDSPLHLAELVTTVLSWEAQIACVTLDLDRAPTRARWEPVLNRLLVEIAMPQVLWGVIHAYAQDGITPPEFTREHYGEVLLDNLLKYLDDVFEIGTTEDRREWGSRGIPETYREWFGPKLTIVWRD